MTEQDGKKEKIIEVALKRFSHFGIEKTTMNDIADDLNISKASLYYYFPDKNSLFLEVAVSIMSQQLDKQQKSLENAESVPEGLMNMIDVRLAFAEQFHMMKIQDLQIDYFYKDKRFLELRDKIREKENIIIESFLDTRIEKGELKEIDVEKTASILNDIFMGIGVNRLHFCTGPNSLELSKEVINSIRESIKDVINLVYYGIKK